MLVVGAGTIGLMHAAMARLHGAGRVVVSDLSEERLALCEALDPAITPIQGVDDAAVARLTGGHGFDVVIVACPSPAAQQVAFGQAAVNGRVCFFGGLPKDRENVALNSNIIHYKQLIVTGTTRASLAQYRKTLSFISSGIIKVDRFATASAPLEGIHTLIDYAKKAQGLKNTVKF
ncbi:MAG: zinc-binding dehydrogenase [Acetanaerobacterium sp.]